MKITTLILLFSILAPLAFAEQSYIEVTAPGNRSLQLAIAPPVALAGSSDTRTAGELAELFRFDLTLAGPFAVQEARIAEGKSGIKPGDFDFAPWKASGADLLLKSGYTVSGSTLALECRLYDVARGSELTAKRYTGSLKELRRMGHTFSDEIMRAVTGEKGPFSGKVAFVSTATGNKEIYLMDYDGFNSLRLTGNRSINLNPDFSPSGREIIYSSYKKGNPDLYRRELFTGAEARLSSSRGINIGGAWAPDGNRIALASSRDGHSQIYLITKDGKQLARLTKSSALDVSPAWSPDGSQLAFVSDRLGKPQVFTMAADGKNVRRLTTSGAYNVAPRWSPKGDRIVYCRQQGSGFQIYAINPDGSGDTQLTTVGSNEHPRWSPDGRFIIFSSKRGGREAIYVMRADGTGQTKVSRGKGDDSHPAWARW
ncbi:MAG TPA: Tol-Pal system beta propeller repeat protein TolB [Geobacteraceae bacterium]|nr:Tol-Pal system beta propeller repeat protein TolB [Geobacteraceae bacterium]